MNNRVEMPTVSQNANLRSAARFSAPSPQDWSTLRPRIDELISETVERERVTIVTAPSGYGKTLALSHWAVRQSDPVAWLSLGKFDMDETLVTDGVISALLSLIDHPAEARRNLQLGSPATEQKPASILDGVLSQIGRPVVLVVDDAEFAGAALQKSLLGSLIVSGPAQLKLIISGTAAVETELSRHVLMNHDSIIGANDLAFTQTEIEKVLGTTNKISAESLWELTQGWPIAVRLYQVAGFESGGTKDPNLVLRDYIRDHVLPSMPDDYAQIALETSIGVDLTNDLVIAITNYDKAGILLDEVAKRGLFVDRVAVAGTYVYRWNELFVRHCQSIAEEKDSKKYHECVDRGAHHLKTSDPLTAISLWLKIDKVEDAIRTLLDSWVWLLTGSDVRAFDQVCAALPEPYSDDPRVLMIRACLKEVAGNRDLALSFLERAELRKVQVEDLPGMQKVQTLSRLLLVDDRATLGQAIEQAYEYLKGAEQLSSRERLGILSLLSWTEVRLRNNLERGANVLEATADEAHALGELEIERRVLGNLAAYLAWAGAMSKATQVFDRYAELRFDGNSSHWSEYGDCGAELARGLIAYWSNRMSEAAATFTQVIESGSSDFSYAGISRVFLAFTALASKDSETLRRAAREVNALPRKNGRGLPWLAYRAAALAALYEADGQHERAFTIAKENSNRFGTPLMTVMQAEMVRRSGDPNEAFKMLLPLKEVQKLRYVPVAIRSTAALVQRKAGNSKEAHRLIEEALESAAPDNLIRPFCDAELEMRQLLTDHLSWGTKHEALIVRCLATNDEGGPLDGLSEREQAVFSYLRTTRTIQEIADELGVSINTVKTHQRSIYRKLGVSSRREAIRKFG